MTERIGVGLVGSGMWGNRLAAAVGRTKNLRLVSCYARSETSRSETAGTFGCRERATLDELLDDPELAGVLVSTPNHTHREISEAAAASGKHVFVEKPIADTLESAEAIVAACNAAGVALLVGHCFRRLGAARATAELLNRGTLGRVVLVEADFSLPGRFIPGSWRSNRRTLLGGPLIQMGVHHSDTIQGWLGPAVASAVERRTVAIEADAGRRSASRR